MWRVKQDSGSLKHIIQRERRHLLRLQPPSYYCDNQDNLPLSPYTQPFSLGRRDWGKKVVEKGGGVTSDSPYLSAVVQLGHPSLFEVQEVGLWGQKRKRRHVRWPWLHLRDTHKNSQKLTKLYRHVSVYVEVVVMQLSEASRKALERENGKRNETRHNKWNKTTKHNTGPYGRVWLYSYILKQEICSDYTTIDLHSL